MNSFSLKCIGELFLILSCLSYSFEWLFIRELSKSGLTAYDIAGCRSLFTCLIIFVVFLFYDKTVFRFKSIYKADFNYIILLSITMLSSAIFFNTAITHTTVANTLILFYLSIFWRPIFGYIFLREKTSKIIFLFIFFAFTGIVLTLFKYNNGYKFSLGIGEIFAIIGSFTFTLDVVFSRRIRHTNTVQRLFLVNLLITLIFVFSRIFTTGSSYFELFLEPHVLLYAFYIGLFCGVIAKWFMYAGYNRTPVSVALVILLLEPITQMTTVYFFGGEKVYLINFIGITLVLSMAISISRYRIKQEQLFQHKQVRT